MSQYFEAVPGGGASVALDKVEISIIRSLSVQLLELVGPGTGPAEDADPLDELFAEGPSEPPEDPVLQRLFPDAYGGPESEAPADPRERLEREARSSEFRRFTENDLRSRKREDALAVVRGLDSLGDPAETGDGAGGDADGFGGADSARAVLELTPEQSRQWLGALNDLRLALGSRLDVAEEEDADLMFRLPDDDPRKPMIIAYLWLGGLQESLVGTLMS